MERIRLQDVYSERDYLKNVTIDNVIFGYHNKQLKVLLQLGRPFSKWGVAGGNIKRGESIEDAAKRIAGERTGLDILFLQKFGAFGDPNRLNDEEFNAAHIGKILGYDIPDDFWIFEQSVSIGFYTLTEFSSVKVTKAFFDQACEWWPVNELPAMMFDTREMVEEALKSLRIHIAHYPIGYELLPKKFTLPEIHTLYETILGKTLNSRNFTTKLMATGIITKLNETRRIGAHRSPFLYEFNMEKYNEGLETGVLLAF